MANGFTNCVSNYIFLKYQCLFQCIHFGFFIFFAYTVAVLIHSGAIYGGHYYAYIKDMDTGKWMNFNDSSVTEIDVSLNLLN